MRILTFSPPLAHSSPLFKNLKILKTIDIFKFLLIQFFFKFSLNETPVALASLFSYFSENVNRESRNSKRLRIPRVKTTHFGRSSLRLCRI